MEHLKEVKSMAKKLDSTLVRMYRLLRKIE